MPKKIAAYPGFADDWNAGVPLPEIEGRLGCARVTLLRLARKHGLPRRSSVSPAVPKLRACPEFDKHWNSGLAVVRIAKAYGVSGDTVTAEARRRNLPPRLNKRAEGSAKKQTRALRLTLPEQRVAGAAIWTREIDLRIVGAGGRYAEINSIAADLGISATVLMARWHRLRPYLRREMIAVGET